MTKRLIIRLGFIMKAFIFMFSSCLSIAVLYQVCYLIRLCPRNFQSTTAHSMSKHMNNQVNYFKQLCMNSHGGAAFVPKLSILMWPYVYILIYLLEYLYDINIYLGWWDWDNKAYFIIRVPSREELSHVNKTLYLSRK